MYLSDKQKMNGDYFILNKTNYWYVHQLLDHKHIYLNIYAPQKWENSQSAGFKGLIYIHYYIENR